MAGIKAYQASNHAANKCSRKSPHSQTIELQELLIEEARNAKGKPMARAVVARAWKELEYLKRDIKMKPKPKPVDVAALEAEKRRHPPYWEMPIEAHHPTCPCRLCRPNG
jgi:hypothetical protein